MRVTAGRLLAGAAVLALVAGVIGGLIGAVLRGGSGGTGSVASSSGCDVSSVAARVLPSLVTINVRGASGGGTGSGSVLDRQGDILTN
ncbi:MAG: hypothetical protein J2P45_28390, partial [Candidatus Dormibacteraeota bacterium]|nr:hypothetical protein [Candidatus Dormibacteraeota bacterium]